LHLAVLVYQKGLDFPQVLEYLMGLDYLMGLEYLAILAIPDDLVLLDILGNLVDQQPLEPL
jgi:hypothetical protein